MIGINFDVNFTYGNNFIPQINLQLSYDGRWNDADANASINVAYNQNENYCNLYSLQFRYIMLKNASDIFVARKLL